MTMTNEIINADNPSTNAESAAQSESNSMPKCDASYRLEYNDDGVFLLIDYGDTSGRSLQTEIVLYDMKRRNIAGFAEGDIRLNIKWRKESIRIAESQEEASVDSDLMVLISRDEMSAELVLFPPCGGGCVKSTDEIMEIILEKWGVTFGLDKHVIGKAADNREYYTPIPIAQGKPAEKGEDGRIIFLFNTEHNYAPKIDEDGSADYKSLNVFENVSEGQVVASIILPGEGTEGCTVKGNSIPPEKGVEAKLPLVKNVALSEDGQSLIALKSGRIDYIGKRVEVTDVYRVAGDVDMSVGNIRFEGDVLVSGNVISGLVIEADGMIEVRGYVEGSTLIAGKDIILKKGMQGMGKGKLVAGGNIIAKFLEYCDIKANGDITADYIVHCTATAGESIMMKGKFGKIVGGTARAAKTITANFIGAVSNELTVLELGASPESRTRHSELIETRNQIREQLEKINNVAKVFNTKNDSSDRRDMREKLIRAKNQLEQQYENTLEEIETLNKILKKDSGARLNVIKSIFPNVKVTIDSSLTTIKNQIDFATFRYSKGEIVSSICETR